MRAFLYKRTEWKSARLVALRLGHDAQQFVVGASRAATASGSPQQRRGRSLRVAVDPAGRSVRTFLQPLLVTTKTNIYVRQQCIRIVTIILF